MVMAHIQVLVPEDIKEEVEGSEGGVGASDDQAVWEHWEDDTSVCRWKMAFGSRTAQGR